VARFRREDSAGRNATGPETGRPDLSRSQGKAGNEGRSRAARAIPARQEFHRNAAPHSVRGAFILLRQFAKDADGRLSLACMPSVMKFRLGSASCRAHGQDWTTNPPLPPPAPACRGGRRKNGAPKSGATQGQARRHRAGEPAPALAAGR
jgi:hypothetical protein